MRFANVIAKFEVIQLPPAAAADLGGQFGFQFDSIRSDPISIRAIN